MKDKVLKFMLESKKELKSKEIAEALNIDKKEVDKAIKELKAEGKIESPKRCYYKAK